MIEDSPSIPAPTRGPGTFRSELLLVLLGIIAFFLLNALTLEKTPTVWCDEVMYQDPAVNLYQGHGFTSGAWWLQARDKFWAGNVPLYQFVLYGWLKVFGFSIASVRCIHYALVSAAVFVAWLAIRRLNLISSPANRLLFCAIICLSNAATCVYRCARPESLSMLIVACALLLFSCKSRPLALALLVLDGILLISVGLQNAAYLCVIIGLIVLCGHWRLLPGLLALCVGCAVGGGLLYYFYASHGVWNDFADAVRHHTVVNKGTQFASTTAYGSGFYEKLRKAPGLFNDYSFVPVFALALWMYWSLLRAGALPRRSVLLIGILASVGVPLALHAVGIFPVYYLWMAFFPLALGFCALLEPWLALHRGKCARLVMLGMVALACLLGLPRRLIVAGFEWNARSYQQVMDMAAPYVASDKLVVCDFSAYYAAKQHAAQAILPNYLHLLTESDNAQISVVILHEGQGDAASLAKQYGGNWRDTGAALKPPPPKRWLKENLDSRQYNLHVFVREPANR